MPENPLLPNAQLRALHSLLAEAVTLSNAAGKKKSGKVKVGDIPAPLRGHEALLAGTLLQLGSGDILVSEPGDRIAFKLLRTRDKTAADATSSLDLAHGAPQLALASAVAGALRRSGSDRLVFALLSPQHPQDAWADTLATAQTDKQPLILAYADASGPDTFRETAPLDAKDKTKPWTWSTVGKIAGKLKLPILSVDGEDAVAVYRVMQESVLRARSGGGPAILWAMLPHPAELAGKRPKAAAPLRRLERYLETRSISL